MLERDFVFKLRTPNISGYFYKTLPRPSSYPEGNDGTLTVPTSSYRQYHNTGDSADCGVYPQPHTISSARIFCSAHGKLPPILALPLLRISAALLPCPLSIKNSKTSRSFKSSVASLKRETVRTLPTQGHSCTTFRVFFLVLIH